MTYFIHTSYDSSGELIFEPGDREAVIAVNILDDTVPEEAESFRVQLKNARGGAEIGSNGYVKITILSNDDAYGVVGFAQVMIPKIPHLEVKMIYSLYLSALSCYQHSVSHTLSIFSISFAFPVSSPTVPSKVNSAVLQFTVLRTGTSGAACPKLYFLY